MHECLQRQVNCRHLHFIQLQFLLAEYSVVGCLMGSPDGGSVFNRNTRQIS
jgi:hypothetical protein